MRGCSEQLKWWVAILKAVYRPVNQRVGEGSVWLALAPHTGRFPLSVPFLFTPSSSQPILPHQSCRAHRDDRISQEVQVCGRIILLPHLYLENGTVQHLLLKMAVASHRLTDLRNSPWHRGRIASQPLIHIFQFPLQLQNLPSSSQLTLSFHETTLTLKPASQPWQDF